MGVGAGRGGGCGRRDGAGERKLMVAQECGEKTRLDFGGLRSFFWDCVPLKRPFANWSLNILIRSNSAKRKMEPLEKNRGSETRAAVSPVSTGFISFDHSRPSSVSTGFSTAAATFEDGFTTASLSRLLPCSHGVIFCCVNCSAMLAPVGVTQQEKYDCCEFHKKRKTLRQEVTTFLSQPPFAIQNRLI